MQAVQEGGEGDWQVGLKGDFFHCCLKRSGVKCKFSLLKASLIRPARVIFCLLYFCFGHFR